MGDRSDIKISINNIVYPVNSLGPGTRIGIWVQGCSMECKRCMAKHTWNINEGKRYKIYQLTNRIEVYKNLGGDKITISGGEPLEQYESILCLLRKVNELGISDIMMYSGYDYAYIENKYNKILKYVAAIISGPFIHNEPTDVIWAGSSNQELKILTDDRKLRIQYEDFKKQTKERKLQHAQSSQNIIGIPYNNDIGDMIDGKN